ncbi:MAG: S-layer homology domain-containing protein [Clostridia bacterium]|nr:S-layer homology domain-containing protein [Clostridia bacterium]
MPGSAASALAVDYGEEYENQPTKTYSQVFSDVSKSHWAFSYIGEMNQRGVIAGYPNGQYYPENYVTRAEFAKIMCVAAGLTIEEVYSTSYYDVAPDEWYAPFVETGRYYLSGYLSNGISYYHPDDNALREDIAVALVKLKGYSTTGADESMLKTMFTDWQSISADARKYVAAALENGLISGYDDNTFRGQDSITRAEAATLLWRAYQYGNGNKTFNDTKDEVKEITKEPVAEATEEPVKQDVVETNNIKEDAAPQKATYSCDTLVKASVSDTFMLSTSDNNGNIYYYDGSEQVNYKLSINNKKKTRLVDIGNLEYDDVSLVEKEVTKEVPKTITKTITKEVPIEDEAEALEDTAEEANIAPDTNTETEAEPQTKTITEEVTETVYETVTEVVKEETVVGTYKDFRIAQVYYNTGNDTLLFAGAFLKYSSDTSLSDKSVFNEMIFSTKGTKASLYSDEKYISKGISGNFDDGRLITAYNSYNAGDGSANYIIINCDDFSSTDIRGDFSMEGKPRTIVITNGSNLYSANFYAASATQSKYSFTKKMWEPVTTAAADFAGVKDKCYYYWDLEKGKIAKSNLDGKIVYIEGIDTINHIDVKDFSNIPSSSL